ncbi:MAG: MerR family transcriptional regulator [Hyphomicrobiales bacterium]
MLNEAGNMQEKPIKQAQKLFTIGQLCREFGVTARTLRFYEDKGLLHPTRKGTSRLFSNRDRSRLKIILRGKRIGFSLSEIKETLELYSIRDGNYPQLRHSYEQARKTAEPVGTTS